MEVKCNRVVDVAARYGGQRDPCSLKWDLSSVFCGPVFWTWWGYVHCFSCLRLSNAGNNLWHLETYFYCCSYRHADYAIVKVSRKYLDLQE